MTSAIWYRGRMVLYEKVRYDGQMVSMTILLICGINEAGRREVLAAPRPMLEESCETYTQLLDQLKQRGLQSLALVISGAHAELAAAVRKNFPGASW